MPPAPTLPRLLPVSALSLAVAVAIAVQLQQAQLWPMAAYALIWAGGLLMGLCWHVLRWPRWILLVCAALLAYGSTGWRASHYVHNGILPATLEGQDLVIEGTVRDLPQSNANGTRFVFDVQSAMSNGQPVKVPNQLFLARYLPWPDRNNAAALQATEGTTSASSDVLKPTPAAPPTASLESVEFRPGEQWRFTVRLKRPHGSRNPHGFDYELWLWERGLGATGYVREGTKQAPPQKLGEASRWHPGIWRDRARWDLREAVMRTLAVDAAPAPDAAPDATSATASPTPRQRAAGVVAALLTGEQNAIEREDWDLFRRTGVAHLMSISGLHITLFAWLAGGVLGLAWRQSARLGLRWCLWCPAPTVAWWGGTVCAVAYAWFSGWGVPAQRTSIMLLVVTLLRTRALRWPWHTVLALAAAAVLLADPWALLQPGFWLSFVAVAVLFATRLQAPSSASGGHMLTAAWRTVKVFFRTQLVITLVLAPLTLLLFGQVSVVGVAANAMAVPLVTFVVTPLALLGALWSPLWHAAAYVMDFLLAILQTLAAVPWAQYQVAAAPWWAGWAGVAGGLLLVSRLPVPWRMAGALALLPVLLWQAPRPAAGQFEVLAADVGQGSAVLIRTRQHSLLFDAGPRYSANSDAGERVLLPLLQALGESPHTLLLSHQDSDHVGGAEVLLQAHPAMQVLGSIGAEHPLHAMHTITPCAAGQHWQWDGVDFYVLHPLAEVQGADKASNSLSCVLHISNGSQSALLTGDVGVEQEAAIIARAANTDTPLQSDLLIAGHHGSKTSTSAAWLAAVQPKTVIVQQGYANRYQHPHPSVMQRLQQAGIHPQLSQSCGAAWWRSDDGSLRCEREENRRYWQNPGDGYMTHALHSQNGN